MTRSPRLALRSVIGGPAGALVLTSLCGNGAAWVTEVRCVASKASNGIEKSMVCVVWRVILF